MDGWYRASALDRANTRGVDAHDLMAPQVQLGEAPSAAADAWSLTRLVSSMFEVDPVEAQSLDTVRAWVRGLDAPLRVRAPIEAPGTTERYRVTPRGWHDDWLGVDVVRLPRPADLTRVRLYARCRACQRVLTVTDEEVVLQAVSESPGVPSETERALYADDAALFAAAGLGLGPEDWRATPFGARLEISAQL